MKNVSTHRCAIEKLLLKVKSKAAVEGHIELHGPWMLERLSNDSVRYNFGDEFCRIVTKWLEKLPKNGVAGITLK